MCLLILAFNHHVIAASGEEERKGQSWDRGWQGSNEVAVVVADKGRWGGWSSVEVESGGLRREKGGWVIRMVGIFILAMYHM